MDGRLEGIKNILRDKGYRDTTAREEIIKLFLSSSRHLNPIEIYEILKGKDVSLSTIYRTLDILKKNDIIKEINVNKKKLYELKIYSGKCIHIHLKCEKCNRLFDIYSPNIALKIIEILNKLERDYNFFIKDSSFIIQGICNECKKEGKPCQDQ